jgi:hypothetical protein
VLVSRVARLEGEEEEERVERVGQELDRVRVCHLESILGYHRDRMRRMCRVTRRTGSNEGKAGVSAEFDYAFQE